MSLVLRLCRKQSKVTEHEKLEKKVTMIEIYFSIWDSWVNCYERVMHEYYVTRIDKGKSSPREEQLTVYWERDDDMHTMITK